MRKSKKNFTQKMYLFMHYGIFILLLLGVFFTFVYSHYKKNALQDAEKDSENVCASISNSIKIQLDNISTISMNIVYSNAIKQNFKEFSKTNQLSAEESIQANSYERVHAIHDIVTAIIGTYQSATQVNIYTMDGTYVEAGYWMRIDKISLEDMEWYKDTINLNGHKYFSLPITRKNLPAQGPNQYSKKFLSMTRTFFDSSNNPEGIVEVVQDCEKIFSLVTQLKDTNPFIDVYVYNSRNELVYPYDEEVSNNYLSMIEKYQIVKDKSQMILTENVSLDKKQEELLYTWQQVKDYEWTVVLTKPKADVYNVLNDFQIIFLSIGILSILFTMLICFNISKRLTRPLEKLTEEAGKITIHRVLDEDSVNLANIDVNIIEISKLYNSIQTMYGKLHTTTKEFLFSQSEEIRAKLQATQSLINPHFLYNSLTNISVMAEENMNDDIVNMCQALCDYFRYISSSEQMIVPLEEEIFYSVRYLECMKFRFGEEFEYYLDIAKNTSSLYIPKLIIQPIIENAFKYAFQKSPPWILKITSYLEENRWIIKITDNGGTLSDRKKEILLKSFRQTNTNEVRSLKIGEMGLKNVYLRLKLLYGEKAIFKIENKKLKETTLILGGPIYYTREEYYEHYPRI